MYNTWVLLHMTPSSFFLCVCVCVCKKGSPYSMRHHHHQLLPHLKWNEGPCFLFFGQADLQRGPFLRPVRKCNTLLLGEVPIFSCKSPFFAPLSQSDTRKWISCLMWRMAFQVVLFFCKKLYYLLYTGELL